jgi:hypothetical protein
MVVKLKPETESRLQELAAASRPAADELVEDAMSGYLVAASALPCRARFFDCVAPDEKPLLAMAVFHGRRNPRVIAAFLRER